MSACSSMYVARLPKIEIQDAFLFNYVRDVINTFLRTDTVSSDKSMERSLVLDDYHCI